jgi:hypothetical protein
MMDSQGGLTGYSTSSDVADVLALVLATLRHQEAACHTSWVFDG